MQDRLHTMYTSAAAPAGAKTDRQVDAHTRTHKSERERWVVVVNQQH